jgi:hypothetical protein
LVIGEERRCGRKEGLQDGEDRERERAREKRFRTIV